MERTGWLLACAVLALSGIGCNSSNVGETATPGTDGNAAATPDEKSSSPDKAVFAFLDAVRTGNDDLAAKLLTEDARRKTAEMQMVVAPPGSTTATFKVGDVEYVTPEKDGAHVASKWTDVDPDGQSHTDDILWILRKEQPGWRIAGMATKIFPNEPPLILNFEDPEDMVRKQNLAEEQMRKQAEVQSLQAQQPGAVTKQPQ